MTKQEKIYLAVGDEYTFAEDDLTIRCVEDTTFWSCPHCCLDQRASRCVLMHCCDDAREDRKSVHFVEVSTEEGGEQ